jgi:hypothetical protein
VCGPAAKAERPLLVQQGDLRQDAQERAVRADSSQCFVPDRAEKVEAGQFAESRVTRSESHCLVKVVRASRLRPHANSVMWR